MGEDWQGPKYASEADFINVKVSFISKSDT